MEGTCSFTHKRLTYMLHTNFHGPMNESPFWQFPKSKKLCNSQNSVKAKWNLKFNKNLHLIWHGMTLLLPSPHLRILMTDGCICGYVEPQYHMTSYTLGINHLELVSYIELHSAEILLLNICFTSTTTNTIIRPIVLTNNNINNNNDKIKSGFE